jgi:hypothetical protein
MYAIQAPEAGFGMKKGEKIEKSLYFSITYGESWKNILTGRVSPVRVLCI